MHTATSLQGISVAPGLAIGPVHVVPSGPDNVPAWTIAPADVAAEIARVEAAVRRVSDDLVRRQERLRRETSAQDAEILGMHRTILQDPGARAEIAGAVERDRVNAEVAVRGVVDRLSAAMRRLDGQGTRGFVADFSEPWLRVIDVLQQRGREALEALPGACVLAAADLTPNVVTYLDRERVLAIVTETGGRFSHGAVLARSLGIPCVIGVGNLLARLHPGMQVSVDGGEGRVQLRPTEDEVREFHERLERYQGRRRLLARHAARPAATRDGLRMEVQVNIESVRDLGTFDLDHCDGIGLFRTEFLFLERAQFPSEEEQYEIYRKVLERARPRPVTMRTLDIGGDKRLPYLKLPREANPALGWRGLRITLEWRDLLRVQLRAMLRASHHGELRILLPMVGSLAEVVEVHAVFDEVRAALVEQGSPVAADIPVGIMVEVPSALLTLAHILPAVDFASVGTNDLVQYLLAVDRDNARVARLYDPHHPAVVLALRMVADESRRAGRPCSLCGEIAGDPAFAVLLLGLGYQAVSVAPHFLPEIRYAIQQVSAEDARSLSREVLEETTAAGVRRRLSAVRARLYDQAAG